MPRRAAAGGNTERSWRIIRGMTSRRRGAAEIAGGHDGRTAVAQVSDQEQRLSPYRRSLFEARSSRITELAAPRHVTRDNRYFGLTPTPATLRRQATAITLRFAIYILNLAMLAGNTGCAPVTPPRPAVQPAQVSTG